MQLSQLEAPPIEFVKQDENGDLYLRAYGITDNVLTTQRWIATHSKEYNRSFIKTPILDYRKHPKVHDSRYYTNLAKWQKDSAAVASGWIEEMDWNGATASYDAILKVTDPELKTELQDAIKNKKPLPLRFSSPAIWGHYIIHDPETKIRIYDKWQGVHLALLVDNPAFPKDIAAINENVCIGGIKCAQELAAVAVGPSDVDMTIESAQRTGFTYSDTGSDFFTFDNTGQTHKETDSINMVGEDDKKTVPYEEYIAEKNKATSFESKYNESLKVNEKLSSDNKTILTERDTLSEKVTAREKLDKKESFTGKLSKIFKDDELTAKVDFAIEKNYTEADLDSLYGPLLKKAEEDAKLQEENNKKPRVGGGVASKKDDSQEMNNFDNALLALSLANARKRVI